MKQIFYKSLGEEAGVVVYESGELYYIMEIPQYGGEERLAEHHNKADFTEEQIIKHATDLSSNWT